MATKKSATHANWKSLVKEYEQGKQSQREFCESNDLVLSRFVYYLGLYRTSEKASQKTPSPEQVVKQFSPLKVASPSSAYQVYLPNGIRASLPIQFDTASVKRLLEILV